MIDTPELLQERMEETKSQLSDKLESLDQHLHVSSTVETTRSAVAATAEAVQATAETVTGALQSVTDALDVRRQMEQNPWIVLGGAAVMGYLAHELLNGTEKSNSQLGEAASKLGLFRGMNGHSRDHQDASGNATASTAATSVDHEAQMISSPIMQLKTLAFNTLLEMARNAATQAVPLVSDYVSKSLDRTRTHFTEGTSSESSSASEEFKNF